MSEKCTNGRNKSKTVPHSWRLHSLCFEKVPQGEIKRAFRGVIPRGETTLFSRSEHVSNIKCPGAFFLFGSEASVNLLVLC